MSTPFIGEIRMFGFNFAPRGWAFCWGQTMSIAQNTALFSILGTTYGGNGQTTFALPDLRGRAPVHPSPSVTLGQFGGSETVTLLPNQMPMHSHDVTASSDVADATSPAGNRLGAKPRLGANVFADPTTRGPLLASSVDLAGNTQPHNNVQPSLGLNFAIALEGVYPSRN